MSCVGMFGVTSRNAPVPSALGTALDFTMLATVVHMGELKHRPVSVHSFQSISFYLHPQC